MTTDGPQKDSAEQRFRRRVASAEINGRRVNEAIEPRRDPDETAVFVCECGHLGCSELLELPLAEYEAVRTSFDRFLIVPGHEIDEVDEVVERHERHLVVMKREPEAREMAKASDPR